MKKKKPNPKQTINHTKPSKSENEEKNHYPSTIFFPLPSFPLPSPHT